MSEDIKLILLLFFLVTDALCLMLNILSYSQYKIYKNKCNSKCQGVVIGYVNEVYVTYRYHLNGRDYLKTNGIVSEELKNKEVEVMYWDKKPEYSYIAGVGTNHDKVGRSMMVWVIATVIGFVFIFAMYKYL
jgi:hypothetical protein